MLLFSEKVEFSTFHKVLISGDLHVNNTRPHYILSCNKNNDFIYYYKKFEWDNTFFYNEF